jgi:hypothetical protein
MVSAADISAEREREWLCRKCINYGHRRRRRDLGYPNKKMESTVKIERKEWTTDYCLCTK